MTTFFLPASNNKKKYFLKPKRNIFCVNRLFTCLEPSLDIYSRSDCRRKKPDFAEKDFIVRLHKAQTFFCCALRMYSFLVLFFLSQNLHLIRLYSPDWTQMAKPVIYGHNIAISRAWEKKQKQMQI